MSSGDVQRVLTVDQTTALAEPTDHRIKRERERVRGGHMSSGDVQRVLTVNQTTALTEPTDHRIKRERER